MFGSMDSACDMDILASQDLERLGWYIKPESMAFALEGRLSRQISKSLGGVIQGGTDCLEVDDIENVITPADLEVAKDDRSD